jgi:hypothetical protein
MPPTQETMRAVGMLVKSQASSRWTCKASSRVGATIRASGVVAAGSNRSASPSRSRCHGQTVGHRLAGAGLGGNQQVAADASSASTASWTGVGLFVVALGQGAGERRTCRRKGHEMGNLDWSGRGTSSGTT